MNYLRHNVSNEKCELYYIKTLVKCSIFIFEIFLKILKITFFLSIYIELFLSSWEQRHKLEN